MPNRIVNVPTVGQVSFPDNMSDADIAAAIQKNYPHLAPKAQAATPLNPLSNENLRAAYDKVSGEYIPEALAATDRFLNTPLGTGHSLTSAYGERLKKEAAGGGIKGAAADTARLALGFGDFAASPAGIATTLAEIGTGGAISPLIGGLYAAGEAVQAGPAIGKAIKKPTPDNVQDALLHTGLAALLSGAALKYRTPAPFEQPTVAPPETPTPAAYPQPSVVSSAMPKPPAPATPAPLLFSPVQPERPESEHPAATAPHVADTSTAHQVLDELQGQRSRDIPHPDQTLKQSLQEARIEATRKGVESGSISSVAEARRRAEEMRGKVTSGELTQQQYDVWARTGKLPPAEATLAPSVGPLPEADVAGEIARAERPMGPQPTQLKPGEELPRPLGQLIKSKLPPRMPAEAPAEPVEPRAEELPPREPAPVATTPPVPGDLEKQLEGLRASVPPIEEKLDYLDKHLAQRGKINTTVQDFLDRAAAGREGTLRIGPDIVFGSERQPGRPGTIGISHAAREAIGKLLGARRVNVLDVLARIPEGALPEHVITMRDSLAEIKENIASGSLSPEELDEALSQSKLLEQAISAEFRPEVKTHGHPTKEQVAAAQGVPPSQIEETGAGKATTIKHGGTLPVMTQAIWENEYGGAKGKFGPAPEFRPAASKKGPFEPGEFEALEARKIQMLQDKRAELAADLEKRKTLIAQIEKHISQRGFIRVTGMGLADELAKKFSDFGEAMQTIRDKVGATLDESRETWKEYLDPRSRIQDVSDNMQIWKGNIDEANYHAAQVVSAYQQAGGILTPKEATAIVDAYKTGDYSKLSQEWKEFGNVAAYKNLSNYMEVQRVHRDWAAAHGEKFEPTAFQDWYFRVLWKNPEKAITNLGRRQLFGEQGWLKQHTLATMSEGIEKGLEPYTWNPVQMALTAWESVHKYIFSMDLMNKLIDTDKSGGIGMRWIPKSGKMFGKEITIPEDYVRLESTRDLKSFLKVPEGLVETGEWYLYKDYARMLDNMLSPDKIRQTSLGRAALGFKNILGAWRLFGPFHVFAMNWYAFGSEIGNGLRETQLGMHNTDMGQIMKGIRDIVTAPAAGYKNYKLGRVANKAELAGLESIGPDFLDSPAGRKFSQTFPHAEEYFKLLWSGGAKNAFMPDRDMVLGAFSNARPGELFRREANQMVESWRAGKGTAAIGHGIVMAGSALPAAFRFSMSPIFETYIPALKLGMMMRDLDISLQERAGDIASGATTKTELARQVVRRTEAFFGQYNPDNLWLKKSIRTALMGTYRSFTWRFGTAEAAWQAIHEQGGEFASAAKEMRAPKLKPWAASWAGLIMGTAVMSAIATRLLTGLWPETPRDYFQPRIGGVDDRGKARRMSWPNILSRDVLSIAQAPSKVEALFSYVTGGMADMWQRWKEAIDNKNFDGTYIVKPTEGNDFSRFIYRLGHALAPVDIQSGPGTFMTQSAQEFERRGVDKATTWALISMGGGPTPRGEDLSPAEHEFQRLNSMHYADTGMSDAVAQRISLMRQITAAQRNNENPTSLITQGVQKGLLNDKDIDRALSKTTQNYLPEELENSQLTLEEALDVYKKATPEEQPALKEAVAGKLSELDRQRDPKEAMRLWDEYHRVVDLHSY